MTDVHTCLAWTKNQQKVLSLPGSSRDQTTDLGITGMERYPIELSCQLIQESSKFL